jgi:hypothetical protein
MVGDRLVTENAVTAMQSFGRGGEGDTALPGK